MLNGPRGRLVTPDPRLEAEYRALGASTTHCDVQAADGSRYTCLSTDEFGDSDRHVDRGRGYDVVACPTCIPVAGVGQPRAVTHTVPKSVRAARLVAVAEELIELAKEL